MGNGNYVMHNFMVTSNGATLYDDTNQNLTKAERYIKGLVKGFSENLKAKYSFELIQEKCAFELSSSAGFDYAINRIHNTCEPIMVDIIKNIDNPIDQFRFIRSFEALGNEVEKFAYGSHFGIITTEEDSKKNYEDTKASCIYNWNYLHTNNGVEQPFDMKADIENDNCLQTTIYMDALINTIAPKMGLKPKDLRDSVNLYFTVKAMKAWHNTVETTLSAHKGCSLITRDMVSVMEDTAFNLMETTQEASK